MNKLSAQYMLDVIRSEMGLDEDQTILRDQNFNYPGDKRLYVVAGIVNSQPIGVESEMISTTGGAVTTQSEVITIQAQEKVQIDIASRDNTSVLRNWEIIAALNSIASKQCQELNNFKIFRIPPGGMNNTSSAEGTAYLNRYTISFMCLSWYRKTDTLGTGDYYDDFTTRVDDEQTIGTDTPLIEFEINQGGIVP